jgi:hypothetical protein
LHYTHRLSCSVWLLTPDGGAPHLPCSWPPSPLSLGVCRMRDSVRWLSVSLLAVLATAATLVAAGGVVTQSGSAQPIEAVVHAAGGSGADAASMTAQYAADAAPPAAEPKRRGVVRAIVTDPVTGEEVETETIDPELALKEELRDFEAVSSVLLSILCTAQLIERPV